MKATTNLLAELQHADHIIKAMLYNLTDKQKSKVREYLGLAGVSGEDMTRAHERTAVIKPVATPASLSLTADEQRILAAFRTMDAQGKRECLIRVEWTAEKWP